MIIANNNDDDDGNKMITMMIMIYNHKNIFINNQRFSNPFRFAKRDFTQNDEIIMYI